MYLILDLEQCSRHFLTLYGGGGGREQLTANTLTTKMSMFSVPATWSSNCERERSPWHAEHRLLPAEALVDFPDVGGPRLEEPLRPFLGPPPCGA